MLETSRVWESGSAALRIGLASAAVCLVVMLSGCATPESAVPKEAPAAPPIAVSPPPRDEKALAEQAKALLAQAETDIQRARSRRALWSKAWESLVLARQAAAAQDTEATARHASRASELAQLGLEQLAYPAVQ